MLVIKIFFSGKHKEKDKVYNLHFFMEVALEDSLKVIKNFSDSIAEKECEECKLTFLKPERLFFEICTDPEEYKTHKVYRFP